MRFLCYHKYGKTYFYLKKDVEVVMNRNTKRVNIKKFTIMLSVMICIVITILVSSYAVFNEIEEQLQQNLEDVANQNSLALYNKIHSNYLLLESLSNNIHQVTPDTIDETLQSFSIFLDAYDLKCFAYAFPDGTSYSTDGGFADLSYREFYQRGMEGKSSITGVLKDALEDSHGMVNVMTIPVYDTSGNVEGVFGLAYNSQTFNDELQIECFDGQGYSCIFNEDGQVMVTVENDLFQLSDNIFTDVLEKDLRNADIVESIQKQIENKTSAGGIFYLEEENYYYCTPVYLMEGDVTWYVLTIIPSDVLRSRALPVQKTLYIMAFIVFILALIGVALIIMLSNEQTVMMLRYAYEDSLTKGANYARFCIDMKKKQGMQGYMIVMDITNFSNINIAAGKAAGDSMIVDIWRILTAELRSEESAAHLRDDFFVMFIKSENKDVLIERLNQISFRIHERAKELQVKGIHARYGICYMQESKELEDIYSKAQIAREQARMNKNQFYVFYDEMDHEKLQQDQQLEERFEESLAEGDFEVWYQPKFSADSEEVVGSEALVRWKDRDGTMISPGRFIPLFERNGMIAKLDEYMFRSVCRQQAQWISEGYEIYPVSINLSRASLYYADIVDKYNKIIQEYGLNPDFIQIEVTESAMEEKADVCELLERRYYIMLLAWGSILDFILQLKVWKTICSWSFSKRIIVMIYRDFFLQNQCRQFSLSKS